MATFCPQCRSADVNALADKNFCLSCGATFVEMAGEAHPVKATKSTKKKG